MLIALTGASGFIGRHLVPRWRRDGHQVRWLSRSKPSSDDLGAIHGSIHNRDALGALLEGADAVVHLAGLVRTHDPQQFDRVNREGTALIASLAASMRLRMLLISSLAAKAPAQSRYAASKRKGEEAASAALPAERLVIIRPPAVYGPGDWVTMPVFRQLDQGWLLVPALKNAKFSMIHVDDLADIITEMLDPVKFSAASGLGLPLEPDDGRDGGYGWQDLCAAGRRLTGKSVHLIRLPRTIVGPLARVCDLAARILRRPMILSSDKLGELYYPSWVSAGVSAGLWRPRIGIESGMHDTLTWYRQNQWMRNA